MKRLTAVEIIEETVNYYSEDVNRRAVKKDELGDSYCEYLSANGNMCAVGRCMSDPSLFDNDERITNILNKYKEEDILKPQYLGHEQEFWRGLQRLHDDLGKRYWCERGLTRSGKKEVLRLKKLYENK